VAYHNYYIREGALSGNGSIESPFGTLTEAYNATVTRSISIGDIMRPQSHFDQLVQFLEDIYNEDMKREGDSNHPTILLVSVGHAESSKNVPSVEFMPSMKMFPTYGAMCDIGFGLIESLKEIVKSTSGPHMSPDDVMNRVINTIVWGFLTMVEGEGYEYQRAVDNIKAYFDKAMEFQTPSKKPLNIILPPTLHSN